ncbi:hypothetical protein DNTS_015816 [Danionella cerebrum]|uniref:CRAL-TRIO domain-containing protein n=1 Tax=Danionella cerebrum TaxID=2873325 RepID=A0A553QXB6_9TELE|nr:hypothetical protein DNTS_015816 [Danionella translucida]
MATDVISAAGVSNQSDMNSNKTDPDSDTPNRTIESQLSTDTSGPGSLSSSVLTGQEQPGDSVTEDSATNGNMGDGDPPEESEETPKRSLRTSTPSRAAADVVQKLNGSFEQQESVMTTEAQLRMEGVELKEEWQDEDFPRPLPEEEDHLDEELFTESSSEGAAGSQSYSVKKTRKKLLAPDISLNLEPCEDSTLSDDLDESTELDPDELDTPSDNSNEFEWEDDLPKPKSSDLLRKGVERVQEYTSTEEREESRRWRVFRYYGDGLNAIIVFAVCFMPESNQPNYRYIMDNLFKYVIGTLELLVAENYMIVYLNGATSRKKMPSVGWLRKCYQQIDRRLRKNLKSLIIVHPSWFIRTLLALTKPFISSKFSQKIKFVYSLTDLAQLVPMEYVSIPDCIKQIDGDVHGKVEMATAAVPE